MGRKRDKQSPPPSRAEYSGYQHTASDRRNGSEGIDAEVELVAVNTEEDARRMSFPGSPTLRVDGRDLFPAEEQGKGRLGCRVYATPGGLKGPPTKGMLKDAMTTTRGADA